MMAIPARKSALAQRLKPAAVAGVGLLVMALNAFTIVSLQRFFWWGFMLGGGLLLAGGFGVVVGEPDDPYGNRPMWFKASVVACAIIGGLLGLLLNINLVAE